MVFSLLVAPLTVATRKQPCLTEHKGHYAIASDVVQNKSYSVIYPSIWIHIYFVKYLWNVEKNNMRLTEID